MPRPKQQKFSSSHSSQEGVLNPGKVAIKTITIPSDRRTKNIPQRRINPEIQAIIRETRERRLKKVILAHKFCIPKASFQRLVKDTMQNINTGYKIQSQALFALQEMSEFFLIELFHNATLCTMHANRKTLMTKDLHLALKLRNMEDYIPM